MKLGERGCDCSHAQARGRSLSLERYIADSESHEVRGVSESMAAKMAYTEDSSPIANVLAFTSIVIGLEMFANTLIIKKFNALNRPKTARNIEQKRNK